MYIYLTTYMYMFVFITKCKLLEHDYTMVSALVNILVWISIAVTKHHDQMWIGEKERVYSAYSSILLFTLKKFRIGSQTGQYLAGRNWYRSHEEEMCTALLPLAYSTCFLIVSSSTNSGMTPPTISCALTHWSLIKKIPYRWILWRHLLSWSSFLINNYRLCQVEMQKCQYTQLLQRLSKL